MSLNQLLLFATSIGLSFSNIFADGHFPERVSQNPKPKARYNYVCITWRNSVDDWFEWWCRHVSFSLFTCFGFGFRDLIQSNLHDDLAKIHNNNWSLKENERNTNKQKCSKNSKSWTITLSYHTTVPFCVTNTKSW